MSYTPEQMLVGAHRLIECLRGTTEPIDVDGHGLVDALVVGSVRRRKPEVRDLDILVCPKETRDLFGQSQGWSPVFLDAVRGCDVAELTTAELTPKSRRITLRSRRDPEVKIELYTTWPQWAGWLALVRTGPATFCRAMMGLAKYRGFRAAVDCPWQGDTPVDVRTERDGFKVLGVPFIAPQRRDGDTLLKAAGVRWEDLPREFSGAGGEE